MYQIYFWNILSYATEMNKMQGRNTYSDTNAMDIRLSTENILTLKLYMYNDLYSINTNLFLFNILSRLRTVDILFSSDISYLRCTKNFKINFVVSILLIIHKYKMYVTALYRWEVISFFPSLYDIHIENWTLPAIKNASAWLKHDENAATHIYAFFIEKKKKKSTRKLNYIPWYFQSIRLIAPP